MQALSRLTIAIATAIAIAVTALIAPVWAATSNPSLDPFDQGVQAYQHGAYLQAAEAFTQAIERGDAESDVRLAAAYSNRCLVHLALDRYPQAIADCTQGLQLNADNSEAYLNRGLAFYRAGKYAAAIADYDQLLARVPGDYRELYNRGLAQFELAHYQAAISDYNRSIQLSPDLPSERMADIYDDRGIAYLLLDQPDYAIADFSRAIASQSSDARAYFNRGCAFHRTGRELAALQDFNQVLAINPHHAETHFNIGLLHYQMGRQQGAIASLQQAADCFYNQEKLDSYQQVMAILHQILGQSTVG